MTDAVLGMGEVGSTLFALLSERGINCVGIDSDESKCRDYSPQAVKNVEFLHVCVPGGLTNFVEIVTEQARVLSVTKAIVVHSTVRPGTTRKIQDDLQIPVLFAPARGVHRRFLQDMKRYTKFLSADVKIPEDVGSGIDVRFRKVRWMSSTKTAELAKILVDTTYYGWLINYAQITKMICDREGIDFDEMWEFADEIHELLGNRPKMYPGVIGGHCVIPNLDLVDYEDVQAVRSINEIYKRATQEPS